MEHQGKRMNIFCGTLVLVLVPGLFVPTGIPATAVLFQDLIIPCSALTTSLPW